MQRQRQGENVMQNHKAHRGMNVGGFKSADECDLVRPQGAVQLGEGLFYLFQGEISVGQVFVELLRSGVSREHWCLYRSYRWPSAFNTKQELRFEFSASKPSIEDFKQALPSGSTYVVATCEQETIP